MIKARPPLPQGKALARVAGASSDLVLESSLIRGYHVQNDPHCELRAPSISSACH